MSVENTKPEEDIREKFTTTLKRGVIRKLEDLSPIYKLKNLNHIIELLVEKDWEAKRNEVEKKRRDI
jgi:CDP-glycerol glycerophosphotransferase (TagB/SpsB family)